LRSFAKFDPRAFLESEELADTQRRQAGEDAARRGKAATLSSLATLAAFRPLNENQGVGLYPVGGLHDRKHEAIPAKGANAAKVDLLVASRVQAKRAAIVEYNDGAERAWAEALARLNPAEAPCDIPSRRWSRLIDDCGRFIDDGWATIAERLGWGPFELFGCDRIKPFSRVSRAGLLWLLNGRQLLALGADAAARDGRWRPPHAPTTPS
jgi:hypothetical protein